MPETKAFVVRIPVELHTRLKSASKELGISMNKFIEAAIEDAIVKNIPIEELKLFY